MSEYFTITELTREFNVSTRTIRFYEDEGLVKPIRRGRTRLFRHSDRVLLKQILRGRRLGFSIAEIREIIEVYKAPSGEEGQIRLMLDRIREKRQELEHKRQDIDESISEMDAAEESCIERLAEIGVSK